MALKENDKSPIAVKISPTTTKPEKIEFEISDTAEDLIHKSEALYLQKSYLQALFGVEEALSRTDNNKETTTALILKARIELKLKSFSDVQSTITKLRPLSPLEASALQVLLNASINHIRTENQKENIAADPESDITYIEPKRKVSPTKEITILKQVPKKRKKSKKKSFNPSTDTYYKRK